MSRSELEELLEGTPVVLCVGPGGVGKTTSSAALALSAASRGKKVLVLTVDPARRLAQSLGMDSLALDETQVSPQRLEAAGIEMSGELWAMMLDTRRIFDRVVTEHAPDPETRESILSNRYYQRLSTSAAGSHEYMAMEQLFTLWSEGRYDLLVLDTPPSQHAFDFLSAPERMSEFFGSGSFKLVRESSRHLGRWGSGLLKKDSMLLKGVGKFLGAGVFAEIIEFLQSFSGMTEGFTQRSREVHSLLRSKDVAFLVMSSPDGRTLRESQEFVRRLEECSMRVGGVVVNRVRASIDGLEDQDSASLEDRVGQAMRDVDEGGALGKKLGSLIRAHGLLAASDKQEIAGLRSRLGPRIPVVEVPVFAKDVVDLRGLARFRSSLFPVATESEEGR